MQAENELDKSGFSAEVIDLRILNPFDSTLIVESVKKTGRLLVIDGGWRNCGIAGEVIASVVEKLNPSELKASPKRITLPDAPAPTSRVLEKIYYPDIYQILDAARILCS
jgi:pyruvate dehydrogenase E1 component beta subunit